MQNEIEYKSLEIMSKIVKEWTPKLDRCFCVFGEPNLNSNDDESNYFSEIEVYIWRNNSIEGVINAILFLQGKRTMTYEELEFELNDQLLRFSEKINKMLL